MKQKIIAITLLLDTLLIALFCKRIEFFCVSNLNFGWTISSLLPKIIIIIFSIIGTLLLFRSVKKVWLWTLPFISSGIAFYSSPIYQGDYNKLGSDNVVSLDTNSIILDIKHQNPAFTGVLAIVSPTCSHCVEAAKRLSLIQKRSPNMEVSYLMFSNDSLRINNFKEETSTQENHYSISYKINTVYAINLGTFPYFVFFKNGSPIHRWRNEQIGYPTLDWIENGL